MRHKGKNNIVTIGGGVINTDHLVSIVYDPDQNCYNWYLDNGRTLKTGSDLVFSLLKFSRVSDEQLESFKEQSNKYREIYKRKEIYRK